MLSYKSLNGISFILKISYTILIIFSLLGIFSDYLQTELLSNALEGVEITQEEIEMNDTRQIYISIFTMVVFLVSYMSFFVWFYRAYFNLKIIGAKKLEFSPGMSVGSFFVPFWNFYKPLSAMKEIWYWTWYKPDNAKYMKDNTIVLLWWGLMIFTNFITRFLFTQSEDTVEGLLEVTWNSIYTAPIDILLIVVSMYIVLIVSKEQQNRLESNGCNINAELEYS